MSASRGPMCRATKPVLGVPNTGRRGAADCAVTCSTFKRAPGPVVDRDGRLPLCRMALQSRLSARSGRLRGSGEELPLRRFYGRLPQTTEQSATKTLPCGIVSVTDCTNCCSSGQLSGSALGQFVTGDFSGARVARSFAGKLSKRPLDLAPDTTDGDAEDALSTLQQVDDLVVAGALVDRRAVAHQSDPGQVVGPALSQVTDRRPDLLEGDAGVEKTLDHLEQEDVPEG